MEFGRFTLDDFIAQMGQVGRLGPMKKVMGMIPGMGDMMKSYQMHEADIERQMKGFDAIYRSMTPDERKMPETIGAGRRRRIAQGAGVDVHAVSSFIRQFEQARDMMRAVGAGAFPRSIGAVKFDRVLGLVTENRGDRDPSYVDPFSRHWRGLRLRLLLSVLAAVAAVACAQWLLWLLR